MPRSVSFEVQVPEQMSWAMVALLFGEDYATEFRAFADDHDRWNNEGGALHGDQP